MFYLTDRPSLIPQITSHVTSHHLWRTTAMNKKRQSSNVYEKPKAKPSLTSWMNKPIKSIIGDLKLASSWWCS